MLSNQRHTIIEIGIAPVVDVDVARYWIDRVVRREAKQSGG
jgi:hypothetical protein